MKLMRCILVLYAGLISCMLFTGCRKESAETVNTAQVDALYADLLSTYRAYADSLRGIPINDTTGKIDVLLVNFENRIWEVNKRYPPELDFHLTQMQNDSLYHYLNICLEIRSKHKHTIPSIVPDSLTSDSTEVSINY